MVVLAGVHAAHQAEVVHLPGDIRQQLRDLDARDRRADRAERAAGLGARLGIPALELAQAAVHVEDDDPLLVLLSCAAASGCEKNPSPPTIDPAAVAAIPARNLRRAIVCSGE